MTRATWYVLEDGSVADPKEVAPYKDGRLRHTSGRYVAMRGDVPSSRGVDEDVERKNAAKVAPDEAPRRGYKTREAKAN
jgi:hypothetical protein